MVKLQKKQPVQLSDAALLPAVVVFCLLQGCATSATNGKIEKGLEASENIAVTGQTPAKSATETTDDSQANDDDPYEGFNRAMYAFNEKVDTYVAEPITTAYKWITPNFLQTGISNFFSNTKTVNVVLNDVLQGKLTQSAKDTGRLLVNSTVGVGGLFDVASHIGLEQHDEDFDQTLAVWGVPKGAYLVLPILGPSTTRGIPGSVVDTAANPVTYVGLPVQVLSMLNARANAEGALKFIDEAALDPYVFTRESYLQWRDFLSTDGKAKAAAAADDFEDELDLDDEVSESAAKGAAGDKSAASEKAVEPHAAATAYDDKGATGAADTPSATVATMQSAAKPLPATNAVSPARENSLTPGTPNQINSSLSKPW